MGLKKQFKFITVCSALLSTVAPVMASPTIAVVHAADTNNSNNSENTNDTKITFVDKQGTSYIYLLFNQMQKLRRQSLR